MFLATTAMTYIDRHNNIYEAQPQHHRQPTTAQKHGKLQYNLTNADKAINTTTTNKQAIGANIDLREQ
eukprot:4245280-Lingulodinium_polyedra.AAC.1